MEREIYNNMRAIESDHWWFRARRAILSDQIRRMRLSERANILEVGCGTGGNLQMLANFGHVTGVEPDDESRTYASTRTGVPVVGGMLPNQLPSFEQPFDLIAALDVIEHLDEDEASVRVLGQLLKPGGRMLTTVPAHPWMWSHHDLVHHHKRRYRKAEYLAIFEKAGLKVTRASYLNSLLFPAIALARVIKLPGKAESSLGDAVPPAPLNALLHAIFKFEKTLLAASNLPLGVSILVIAERPA